MMRITPVTKFLLLVNVVVFLFMASSLSTLVPLFDFQDLEDMLGLHFFLAPHFHFYQIFTYMFVHAGFTHILFNMFGLWMFGPILERVWGGRRFLFYYLSCGLGAGLFQEAAQLVQFYAIMSSQVPHFALSNLLFYAQEAGAALNTWTTVGAGQHLWRAFRFRNALSQRAHVHHSLSLSHQSQISCGWLCCGRAVASPVYDRRQRGPFGPHWRHGDWLFHDSLLAETSHSRPSKLWQRPFVFWAMETENGKQRRHKPMGMADPFVEKQRHGRPKSRLG